MATRDEVYKAILEADKAGRVDDVKTLGAYLKTLDAAPVAKPKPVPHVAAVPNMIASMVQGAADLAGTAMKYGGLGQVGNSARFIYRAVTGNAPSGGVERAIAATEYNPFEQASGAIERAVPVDPNSSDSWVRTAGRGVGGAGITMGVGALGSIPALTAQPVLQLAMGATGSLAAEAARLVGLPWWGQIGAGLVGGIAPAGGVAAARGVAHVLPGAVETGAARILQGAASDPAAAAAAIAARPARTISRAAPTTAEVAADPGIAGLQRASANLTPGAAGGLGERTAANALARQAAADLALGKGDTADVSNYAARQAAALEAATGRDIAKVGALEPYDVSGDAARGQLEEARKVSNARVAHAYEHPDIVDAQSQPVRLAPPDMVDNLPQPVANPERAAFEQAARAGLKAGDTSNKATGGLASWIISRGGIQPNRVEQGFTEMLPGVSDLYSAGINPKSRPGLFSKNGSTLDNLLTAAQDAGFFPKNAPNSPNKLTVDDLVQALTDDVNGRPVYRQDDLRGLDRAQANAEADYWGSMFQRNDMSPEKMTPDDWDALYRDVQELPPHTMTEADAVAMGGEGVGRPVGAMQSALLGLRHDFYAAGEVPPVIDDAIKAVVSTEVATVRDVSAMSRRFRDLADRTDSGTDRAFLRSAADAVDGFLRVNAGPEYADALKAAQRAAREHHDIFSRGNVGAALAKTMRGGGRTDTLEAGKVPSRLVPASDKTGAPDARQLKTALGDTGAETVAREELRRELDKAGNDAGRIAAVEAKYKGVLGEFPALSADIAAAGETAAAHAAFLKSPLGSLRDGNVDVASKVATALGRGGNAELHGMIAATRGDAAAQAGLRRAIAQYVVPGGPSAVVTAGGKDVPRNLAMYQRVTNVLERTKGTNLLTNRQRAVLSQINSELKAQQFASSAARASGSDTGMNATLAAKFLRAGGEAALVHGVPGGGPLMRGLKFMSDALSKTDKIHALVNRAMLEPDLAAALLLKPTAEHDAALAEILRSGEQGSIAGAAANAREPAQ